MYRKQCGKWNNERRDQKKTHNRKELTSRTEEENNTINEPSSPPRSSLAASPTPQSSCPGGPRRTPRPKRMLQSSESSGCERSRLCTPSRVLWWGSTPTLRGVVLGTPESNEESRARKCRCGSKSRSFRGLPKAGSGSTNLPTHPPTWAARRWARRRRSWGQAPLSPPRIAESLNKRSAEKVRCAEVTSWARVLKNEVPEGRLATRFYERRGGEEIRRIREDDAPTVGVG